MLSLEAESEMNFFHEVLNKCTHITTPQFSKSNEIHARNFSENTNKLLGVLNRDFIDKLTRIFIGNFKLVAHSPCMGLGLGLGTGPDTISYVHNCSHYTRNGNGPDTLSPMVPSPVPCICPIPCTCSSPCTCPIPVPVQCECAITILLSNKEELHIVNISHNATLQASGKIPHCPILTHITAEGNYVHVDRSVAMSTRKAVRRGKLPCFRRIEILTSCLCCRYD